MAATSSKQLSFAMSYGFLGGRLSGHSFRHRLTKAGFRQTNNVTEADIVIAHSAGCWELAGTGHAKLIVLVGLPLAQLGPATSLRANRARVVDFTTNGHPLRGLESLLLSLYYGFREPRRNFRIIRHGKQAQASLVIPTKPQVIMVSNRHDPWTQSDKLQAYLDTEQWAFISLPGSHDNIWEQPERYVAIINHYARLLA